MIENDEIVIKYIAITTEEKIERLIQFCQKQIEHFILYRDIIPEIQDLLMTKGDTLTEVNLHEDVKNTRMMKAAGRENSPELI